MGFTARCCTRADDANPIFAGVRMCDEQETLRRRHPESDEATLLVRVIWIVKRLRQWIQENRLRLVEGDTVLAEIAGCLLDVPFVDQRAILLPPSLTERDFNAARAIARLDRANESQEQQQLQHRAGTKRWEALTGRSGRVL